MGMDISQLQSEIDRFAKERDWEKFHTLKNLILALVGETGELAAVVQWLEEVDKEFLLANPSIREDFADELADVFIYLLRIADIAGIDPIQAAVEKMRKNQERYTIEKSKGNAEKQ